MAMDSTVDEWRRSLNSGCSRQAKILLGREGSGPVRLLLRVALDPECCSHGPFFYVEDVGVPEELCKRGLTKEVWGQWMMKLRALRRSTLPVGCHPVRWAFQLGELLTLGTLSCCVAPPGKRRFLDELAGWQAGFNEPLSKLGLAVKTQSFAWGTSVAGRRFEKMLSWLTFALTPEESDLLGGEPHLFGEVRSGCCAPGPLDETDQPIHLAGADAGGLLPRREHIATSKSALKSMAIVPTQEFAAVVELETKAGVKYVGERNARGGQHGHGTLTMASGNTYVGQFRDGKMEGRGTVTTPPSSDIAEYECEFKEGKREGQGTERWRNGDTFVGQFVANKRAGPGKLTCADGSSYEGEWRARNKEGAGKHVAVDGSWCAHPSHGRWGHHVAERSATCPTMAARIQVRWRVEGGRARGARHRMARGARPVHGGPLSGRQDGWRGAAAECGRPAVVADGRRGGARLDLGGGGGQPRAAARPPNAGALPEGCELKRRR